MTATTATPRTSLWKGLFWPAVIVVLLVGHVLIVSVALLLSSALIPAASTAPSGYAEALSWDERQALLRDSEALGWTVDVRPAAEADVAGNRRVVVLLHGRDGRPIDGATVGLSLYHHSRPQEVLQAVATPTGGEAGGYTQSLRLRREGQWRLSVVATRGADRFFAETDFWLPRAEAPR